MTIHGEMGTKMSYVVQGKLHIAKKTANFRSRHPHTFVCVYPSLISLRAIRKPAARLSPRLQRSSRNHISSRAQPQWQSGVRNPAANIVHVLVATSLTPTTNIILATICSRRRAQAARIP